MPFRNREFFLTISAAFFIFHVLSKDTVKDTAAWNHDVGINFIQNLLDSVFLCGWCEKHTNCLRSCVFAEIRSKKFRKYFTKTIDAFLTLFRCIRASVECPLFFFVLFRHTFSIPHKFS